MSSLLSSYESEYKSTLAQAVDSLASARAQSLSDRNSTLSHVEEQKDELLDLVDQMDIEVNNSITDATQRAGVKARLREYRKEVADKVRTPLQQLMDARDRDMLFGGAEQSGIPGGADANMTEEQRQQLLQSHNVLNRTGDRLRDASRIAAETEGIGSQIMADLRAQRETLENSRQTLFQADSYVDKSIKTLKTMSRRLVANKFISYAIIAVLILLILLVLFSKFK